MPRKVTYEVTILGTDGGISVYYLETDWETDWQTDWETDWDTDWEKDWDTDSETNWQTDWCQNDYGNK